MVLYVELFNLLCYYMVLTFPKKHAFLTVILFCCLLLWFMGFNYGPYVLIVFPSYVLIYHIWETIEI